MGIVSSTTNPKPGFVVLETGLPISVAHFLLGCVVADPANPTDYFRPSKNADAFRDYELEITETSYGAFVKKNKDQSLNARVGELIGMDTDTSVGQAQRVESGIVRTRTLMQHEDIKDMLMDSPAQSDIVKLMHKYDGRGFLVVGLMSAVKGQRSRLSSTTGEVIVRMDAPVSAAVAGVSHGMIRVPAEKVDPAIKYTKKSGELVEMTSTMKGEHIFAVRYRVLLLKAGTVHVGRESRVSVGFDGTTQGIPFHVGPDVGQFRLRNNETRFEQSADEFVLSEEVMGGEIETVKGGKKLKFVY
jgi:hypothetical protein